MKYLLKVLKDLDSLITIAIGIIGLLSTDKSRGIPKELFVLLNFISTYDLFRWNKTKKSR